MDFATANTAEVEQVINRMEGVKECAAFSMPHNVLGEVVEIAIVRTGPQPTAARVKVTVLFTRSVPSPSFSKILSSLSSTK